MYEQPNDSKYKLWQGLSEKKLYTKSYDDFEKQFSTEKAVTGLYDALSARKLYTKTKDDFNNQFFGAKNTLADKKETTTQKPVKKEEPYNFEKSFLYNIGADEWQGSVGRIKPTPMQYMEAEAKKAKPSEAIYKAPTGARDIKTQADLQESEAAFQNFTEKRLRSKGVEFKKGDANYKKEQQLILNDIKNADIFGYIDDNGNIDFARSVGFGKQFLNSFVGSISNVFKATKVNTISDPRELADYANEEEKNRIVEKGSEIAAIAGGLPKLVGEVALGTAYGGPTGGASLVASDAYWTGISEKRLELYYNKRNELIDKGMDKTEAEYKAAAQAMEDAPLAAVPTAITNYVMASMGGTGKSITPLSESREAFKKYILQPTKVATLGAVQPLTEYGIESAQGYDVTFKDAVSKMGKGFVDFGLMDLGMHVVMNPGKFAKSIVSSAKEYLSHVPKDVINPMTTKYGEQGQSVINNLESYNKAREKVAPYMPQNLVHHVAGLQEAIDNGTAKIERLKSPEANTPQAIINTEEQQLAELKKRQNAIIESGDGEAHEVDVKTGEPVGVPAVAEPTKQVEQPKEITSNIKFKSAEGEDIYGKRIDIPGHEDFHIIIVDGENGPEVWEQSIGRKLGIELRGSTPIEDVPNEIANYLDKNKLTSDWLYNQIEKADTIGKYTQGEQKFKLANETEGYKKYKERKQAEKESLPFVYKGEQRAELDKLRKEAEDNGEEKIVTAIDVHLNAREGTAYNERTIDDIKSQVDFIRNTEQEQKIKKQSKEQGVPYPDNLRLNEDGSPKKEGTPEELEKSLYQFYKKPQIQKISKTLRAVIEEAYAKSSAILNKYGYYPDDFINNVTQLPENALARLLRSINGRNLEFKEKNILQSEAEVYEMAKQIDEYAKKEGIDLGTSAIEGHETEAHKQALLETVKGTEYENQARDAGLRTETTKGTTGEVSGEPKTEIEQLKSATEDERADFEQWKSNTYKSESDIDAAYERSGLREYGQSREDFLIGEYCK